MKLDYNKVISQKLDIYDDDEFKKLKEKKRRDDKKTIGRPEWVYYLWYLHLKLCLEMEEKGIPIQQRLKYRSGVKEQRKVSHIHRLKINRKFYEGINWDELKSLPWSKWKKRYLDFFMTGGAKEILHGDNWQCEPHYMYLEVDLRNTETVLVNQYKKLLKDRKSKIQSSNVSVQGKPNYHSSILGYNMTVSMIQGNGWRKIVEDENLARIEILMKEENYNDLDQHLKSIKPESIERVAKEMQADISFVIGEFEGYCFANLHRYILDTQRVLFNVSQGRFFDKTDLPKDKWKDKWSPKTYTW